jgi:alanyl-tRNA synthetase
VTERLYYKDPYQRSFTANVVDLCEVDGQPAVVLDASAFYPTAGGQPYDTGTLDGVRVVDVQIDGHGQILHVLDSPLPGATTVHGEIDWERRFDHMQQHTGQHILSQAFVEICQAETVGFHLGEGLSTIDLDHASLSPDVVSRAQKSANAVVMDSREVIARFVDQDELATLPARKVRARKVRARKMPTVQGPIRLVEVSQYDWSLCGGTHVCNSGQIGPIQIVRLERRNDQTRIHFVCGWRALSDYTNKSQIVQELAAHFTTSESEILPSVQRIEAEIKGSRKALTAVQIQLLDYEIVEWLAQADRTDTIQVVRLAFDQRDASLLKEAARQMTENPATVVLLATRRPRPQFVFARSEDLAVDMGAVMRTASAVVDGRGGGRPQFAQGGAPEGAAVDRVLDEAVGQLGIL